MLLLYTLHVLIFKNPIELTTKQAGVHTSFEAVLFSHFFSPENQVNLKKFTENSALEYY